MLNWTNQTIHMTRIGSKAVWRHNIVGGVVHLLEDERAHKSVGVSGRATQAGVEDGGECLDRQVGQGLLAEKSDTIWKQ